MRPSRRFERLVARAGLMLAIVRGVPAGVRESIEGESEPIHPGTRAEHRDVNVRAVFWTGVGLLVALWIIVLLMYPLFAFFRRERAEAEAATPAASRGLTVPPGPRLQSNPRRDLQEFRKYEEGQLNGYHWVDHARGVVSLPIERAIEILAQRGIPPQPAPPGMTYFDPRAGTRQTGFEGKVEPEPK
ncbi:MAG TPA: hypothetical protein VKX45_07550 [Bryobacteraceae bacterium]|nr:hypothetical protein [Bryobacteraceae bacterium]